MTRIKGWFSKTPPEAVSVPDEELRFALGVKSGQKVCLFHAPKYILPLFLVGDLKLTMDWVESDSDVILYWLQPQDDAVNIMTNLELMIKRNGRVWLVVPQKEAARKQGVGGWGDIRSAVLEATSLVDNKTLVFGNGECGTQFVPRKAVKEKRVAVDMA